MSSYSSGETQPAYDHEPAHPISRRAILCGIAATGIAAALGGGTVYHKETGWPEHFTDEIPLDPRAGDQLALIDSYDSQAAIDTSEIDNRYLDILTDKGYLRETLQQLRHTTDTPARATSAMQQSLRLVRTASEYDTRGFATVWQIDEGGIYVTAKHVVRQALNTFTNPFTNTSVGVAASLIHPEADIALVIAPTGLPPRPAADIRLASSSPRSGEVVRMIGLFPRNSDDREQSKVYLYEKQGTVSETHPHQVKVKGLVPLGGTSGSPIIDTSTGAVVGVESGLFYHYPDGPNLVSNYAGAIIAPISLLDDLV